MRTTEAKHWTNGYSKRGNIKKFLSFRLFNYGILITNFKPYIEIYKLIYEGVKNGF